MSEIVKLTVNLTRKYGAVETSFGIQRDVEVTTASDILRGYDVLCQIVEAQIIEYENNRLKDLPAPVMAQGKGAAAAAAAWFPATKLILSVNNGKKFWRIMPGGNSEWKKYGATIFWDTFEGMTEAEAKETLQPGEFEAKLPDGARVLIAVQGGRPKAIKLVIDAQKAGV